MSQIDKPIKKYNGTGNYFRCRVNKYYNIELQEVVSRISFKRLKRKSRKGECARIGERPEFDFFEEDMGEDVHTLAFPNNPVDGKIYELMFVPLWTDWETGYLDEWQWRLLPVPEVGE